MIAPNSATPASPERLAEIRRQVALGTYETPEKLSAAVDALYERAFDSGRPYPADRSKDET